mgnify:CR=1 FL=1
MSYTINDINLSSFGITPIRTSQGLALSGILDFPGRAGETEKSWGVETEAFVSAADLKWNERPLVLNGLAKAATASALRQNLADFNTLLKSGLLALVTPHGSYSVVAKNRMQVVRLTDTAARFELNLTEQEVSFASLTQTASGGTGYRLAGFNLHNDFGIRVQSINGHLDLTPRIEVNTTALSNSASYRAPKDIVLSCFMTQTNLTTVISKMQQFHALLASPGLKTLIDRDGASYSVYARDSFTVTIKGAGKVIARFELKLRAV